MHRSKIGVSPAADIAETRRDRMCAAAVNDAECLRDDPVTPPSQIGRFVTQDEGLERPGLAIVYAQK